MQIAAATTANLGVNFESNIIPSFLVLFIWDVHRERDPKNYLEPVGIEFGCKVCTLSCPAIATPLTQCSSKL